MPAWLGSFFKKRFYLFIFRQRGRVGEREGKKHQHVVASHAPPTGDLACNPGICPDWELNQQPFGSQAGAQSTEPHQPRQQIFFPFHKYPGLSSASVLLSQEALPTWYAHQFYSLHIQAPHLHCPSYTQLKNSSFHHLFPILPF